MESPAELIPTIWHDPVKWSAPVVRNPWLEFWTGLCEPRVFRRGEGDADLVADFRGMLPRSKADPIQARPPRPDWCPIRG